VWSGLLLAVVPARVALGAQPPGTAPPIKRIVSLFSEEITLPGNLLVDRGLRTTLAKDPSFHAHFYQEFLDLTRFGGEEHEQRLASVLSQKYGGRLPDLLVTVAPPAALFAARWAPIVFPGVPVVYVAPPRAMVSRPGINATQVPSAFDFRGTVRQPARRPQTHRVVVTSGATAPMTTTVSSSADPTGPERQVRRYLNALPMGELRCVARMPQDTGSHFHLPRRAGFSPPNALELVAARSAVPVFSPVGVPGPRHRRHLFSWEHAGVRTAELALRVLHGANPRDVPPSSEDLCSWMFDARQLKRWGIRESALPPGSAVRFREPSLWRQHPWGVLGVILFILAETALVVGLVFERRQRQRAQEQQRRLLSAIVESSNDAIIGIDTETRIVSWNTGAQNVFGYTAEEAIGHGADLLVPPDRLNEARSAFEATMAGRTVAPFETVRLRKDGSPVEVSITDSPIRDPWGEIVGISSTQRDITEHRRIEEALRRSEEHLTSVFSAMTRVSCSAEADGRVITYNATAERILRQALAEIRGPLPSSTATRARRWLLSPVESTHRWSYACTPAGLHRHRDGPSPAHRELTWISINSQPVSQAEGGALIAVVVTISDITDRKRAEQAVRASEARFRQFFTEVPDYCYIVSMKGEILDVNRAALAALGYQREELVGKRLATIYAPESQARMKELFAQWQRTGLIVDEEIVIVSKSGERSVVILNAGAERDQNGNILHSTSVQTDITERKRAEAERHQLQQELSHVARVTMMGELTSSLAHELNQPLTAILSNAQTAQRLLADGQPDREELREILADIVADDDRAGEIIQRLRTLLKKGELEFRELDVNELVLDVARLVGSNAIIKSISVTLDLASDLPRVRADRVQLQQVILNLMLNALDAVMSRPAADRKLLVSTEAGTDGTVHVAVRDSGPGIPPDKLERVFEPFFTTKASGMGMGLAIARSPHSTEVGCGRERTRRRALYYFLYVAVRQCDAMSRRSPSCSSWTTTPPCAAAWPGCQVHR
jgi:PAS domain S-box-containing protein